MKGDVKLLVTTAAVLGLMLAALPAQAVPGEKDSVEVGIYAGIGMLDEYAGLEPDDGDLFGLRLGTFFSRHWGVEYSYQRLASDGNLGIDLDITSYRGNVLFNFLPERRLRPFVTAGVGLEDSEIGPSDSVDPGINAGGGLRWYALRNLALRLDGRFVHTDVGANIDEAQSNVETTLGASYVWGGGPPADTDGDGVPDRKDDCQNTPLGAVVAKNGCPLDGDGDGVWDGLDACPDTPAGCPVDAKGCPLDTDGDGVIDCQDSCADTANGCTVDGVGCPKDEDGDGICDGLDTCAGTPAGCRGDAKGCPVDTDGDGVIDCQDKCAGSTKTCPVDATGCPEDEDGDGVCDGLDKCPGTPAGSKVDAKGCPSLFVEKTALVLEGVTFETDSATLVSASAVTLDAVAASLAAWSDISVEIAGHTDASGGEAHNLALSQRRAESVRDYLVKKGVTASRLTAKGYGESQPIADNSTAAGKATNRRVELKKLD